MTTAPGRAGPAPHPWRRATRDAQTPVVGGVAGGLATHLGVPVVWVRAGFVATTAMGGLGVFLYAALWIVLPADSRFECDTPGAESAGRAGRRPGRVRRLADAGPAMALSVLAVGGLLLVEGVLGAGAVVWPLALGLGGLTLLWRQADEAQRERWLDGSARLGPLRVVFGAGGWAAYARVGAGVALVVSALVVVAARGASWSAVRTAGATTVLGVAGLALVVGPWMLRLASDLSAERAERVRTQERADVAAHLHDSVLQTLALIQVSAADPASVVRLARAQERDLRSWLYTGGVVTHHTVADALRAMAAGVEDAHGVQVDVVVVGDRELCEAMRPVVAAAGEAITNAARHAGADRVDVYAELPGAASAGVVKVFIRDRGRGFDRAGVATDRHGVCDSIEARMRRHGGSGEVRSAPGQGTEVVLRLPVTRAGAAAADSR